MSIAKGLFEMIKKEAQQLRLMASERLTLNLGVLYTQYVQGQRTVDYPQYGINGITETYNRNNIGFGIGFDFSF